MNSFFTSNWTAKILDNVGISPPCEVLINLKDSDKIPKVTVNREEATETLFLFQDQENISGTVTLHIQPNKRVEHNGFKIELIGQVELEYEKSTPHIFTSLVRELELPGIMYQTKEYSFDFTNVEKPHESYYGSQVKLRYFLRAKLSRSYAMNVVKELEFAVQNVQKETEINPSIKMEVGIEDCLHIEFEYGKKTYHLDDVVIGKIYFLLVRLKVKYMEVQIMRRETIGSGASQYSETEVVTKFEIMDGAPMRGERIPIRIFLSPYDLTPTYDKVHNKFSVRYYLNLVLIDKEERRYFKQQEITLWRKALKSDNIQN